MTTTTTKNNNETAMEFVSNVLSKDFEAAKTNFSKMFYEKSIAQLADRKINVAKNLYRTEETLDEKMVKVGSYAIMQRVDGKWKVFSTSASEKDAQDELDGMDLSDDKKKDYKVAKTPKQYSEEKAPSAKETLKKIEGFGVDALKGYAKKVGVDPEALGRAKGKEMIIDEIMVHLFDEDWLAEIS